MTAGSAAYSAWLQAFRPNFDCRRTEYLQAVANLRAREAEFRPLNDKAQSIGAGWEADVAEFNARPARSRR